MNSAMCALMPRCDLRGCFSPLQALETRHIQLVDLENSQGVKQHLRKGLLTLRFLKLTLAVAKPKVPLTLGKMCDSNPCDLAKIDVNLEKIDAPRTFATLRKQ